MSSPDVKRTRSPLIEQTMSGDGPTLTVPGKRKRKENWRLVLLSKAKSPRGKYEKPDETFNSGVNPEALTVELSERNEHLSRPPLRTLVINKRLFSTLPTTFPNYEERMDNKIEYSWASMYNYYKKAKRDLARERSKRSRRTKPRRKTRKSDVTPEKKEKGKKGKESKDGKKGKKGKAKEKGTAKAETKSSEKLEEDIEKEREIWVNLRSVPKVVHKPEPIKRGPIADLEQIKHRMIELATPSTVTPKFIERPIIDLNKIKEEVLTYEATERILELTRPPAFWLVKEEPLIPGAVKPGALQAEASPRILELAVPKETVNAKDADLKEDPFLISPNALKYVATERIVELARPITRK